MRIGGRKWGWEAALGPADAAQGTCYNNAMNDYPLTEQKLVYRVLHRQLTATPELLDCEFLHDLQVTLQRQAQADGVDVADHGAWDAWLGNAPVSCEVRVAIRRVLN